MTTRIALKIEKGVPIPERFSRKGYASTFRKMKIGDSVFIHEKVKIISRNANHVLGGGNYSCRAERDGCRIWRTK